MERAQSFVLLIGRFGNDWVESCERELQELGTGTVQAHNCWSGEVAMRKTPAEVVIIDAAAMCSDVSAERPHALLYGSPRLPVLIVNAQDLDPQQRHAAEVHKAHLLEGCDVREIVSVVQRLLRGATYPAVSAG